MLPQPFAPTTNTCFPKMTTIIAIVELCVDIVRQYCMAMTFLGILIKLFLTLYQVEVQNIMNRQSGPGTFIFGPKVIVQLMISQKKVELFISYIFSGPTFPDWGLRNDETKEKRNAAEFNGFHSIEQQMFRIAPQTYVSCAKCWCIR